MPMAQLFILVFPKIEQVYFVRWLISIFFAIFQEAAQWALSFPTLVCLATQKLALDPESCLYL